MKNNQLITLTSYLLIIFLVTILTSCTQTLSSNSLDKVPVILSSDRLTLEPLQTEDILLGVKNNFDVHKDFYIIIECKTSECEENVVLQTFPTIGLEKDVRGVFPIRVIIPENAKKGEYVYELIVKQDGNVYGSDILTIEVKNEVGERIEKIKQEVGV